MKIATGYQQPFFPARSSATRTAASAPQFQGEKLEQLKANSLVVGGVIYLLAALGYGLEYVTNMFPQNEGLRLFSGLGVVSGSALSHRIFSEPKAAKKVIKEYFLDHL